MVKGLVFDVKRYAIHDGPGVRTTVFFKGCPLRCRWCQNPEGQDSKPEIMFKSYRCVEECNECVSVCRQNAIRKAGKSIEIDKNRCDLCLKCREVCVYEALEIVGREVTVHDLVEEVKKDRIFFDESGGGITLSGGEPLMQPDFLDALLGGSKEKGIQTVIDTSGYVSYELFDRVVDKVDLFLYDIKLMDEEKHKRYTGVSNKVILENLRRLSRKEKAITVRIPVIPGINDDSDNIHQTAEYLLSLKNIRNINLLPFHKGGSEKYKRLGRKNRLQQAIMPPSNKTIWRIKEKLMNFGFSVKTGG